MSVGNQSRNILITGGRGFIGVNLVRHLQKLGDNVRVLDNLSLLPNDPTRDNLFVRQCGVAWCSTPSLISADIRDEDAVLAAATGADIIIHLAANSGVQQSMDDPLDDMDCNIRGTLTCLRVAACVNVSRFIFASSGAPLGMAKPPITEHTLPRPISPYGASKLAGEAYCMAYSHSFNVKSTVLRFSNVYGPYSDHKTSLVGRLLHQAMNGQAWEVYGNGHQTRDFIFVQDLVEAIISTLDTPNLSGEVFQIASGDEISINQVIECLSKLLEKAAVPLPKIHFMPARAGDMSRTYANIQKAQHALKWRKKTTLEKGITKTLFWFLEKYKYHVKYSTLIA